MDEQARSGVRSYWREGLLIVIIGVSLIGVMARVSGAGFPDKRGTPAGTRFDIVSTGVQNRLLTSSSPTASTHLTYVILVTFRGKVSWR